MMSTTLIARPRIPRFLRSLLNIRFREEDTAIRQVEALAYRAAAVRHIVLTPLNFDYAGGLEDFPGATVHLMAAEYDAATGPRRGFIPRRHFRAPQFDGVADWPRYGARGERWSGFDAVRDFEGLPAERLMAPSPAVARVMPRWRSADRRADCCTPATPVSTGARCDRRSGTARQACAATNG